MKNIPNKIYLQIGDECPDDADFNELAEVTWCSDKIFTNDIEYRLHENLVYKYTDESTEKDKTLCPFSELFINQEENKK